MMVVIVVVTDNEHKKVVAARMMDPVSMVWTLQYQATAGHLDVM